MISICLFLLWHAQYRSFSECIQIRHWCLPLVCVKRPMYEFTWNISCSWSCYLCLSVRNCLWFFFLPAMTSSWTWQLFLYAMINFINKYNNSISLKQGASLRKSFIYLAYQTFIKTGFLSQFLLIPHILTDIVTTPISNQLLLMIAECLCIPNF